MIALNRDVELMLNSYIALSKHFANEFLWYFQDIWNQKFTGFVMRKQKFQIRHSVLHKNYFKSVFVTSYFLSDKWPFFLKSHSFQFLFFSSLLCICCCYHALHPSAQKIEYISLQKQLLCIYSLWPFRVIGQIQSSKLCILLVKPPELSSDKWFFVQISFLQI